MRRPRTALRALPLALLLAACGGGDSGPAPVVVTGVAPLPGSLELVAGDEQPLSAVVLPDPGVDQAVVWGSANPSVARVSAHGTAWTVRGLARGTTQLTVSAVQDPSVRATVPVTVVAPATLAFLDQSALWDSTEVLSVSTDLQNRGDLAATGVTLVVSYEIGQAGWLTVTPAAAAPFDVAVGGAVRLEVTASAAGLAPGLYAAAVTPVADPGVIFGGNPFTVLLRVLL